VKRKTKKHRTASVTMSGEFRSYQEYVNTFLSPSEDKPAVDMDDPIAFGNNLADLSLTKLEKLLTS